MKSVSWTHKGKYKLKKPEKYKGDMETITYRSSWERAAFLWAEKNSNVVEWSSEEVVIPYFDEGKGKARRYFIDLYLKFNDGNVLLVEIKPKTQTKPPKGGRGKKKSKVIEESMTYITNSCKWQAAKAYANKKGWKFQIWDEAVLKKMGILKW